MKHSQIMANASTATVRPAICGCTSTQSYSRRERDDNYWGVIVVLNDRFRVIIDEPCDQFIVQKHYAESLHGDVWRGQSYLTTKDSLMKACVRLGCLSGSNQWLLLDALPSTIREYAAQIGLPR
ncbi:hypothetical protein OAB79_02205 [Yoonia sp.]|nr:hypothetical protein [Yoonia sp.]